MWRLLGGELLWALRQLIAKPWVLIGLLAGFFATLGVLGTTAPGPVLASPWRLVAAIAAGWLVAAGVRELQQVRSGRQDRAGEGPDARALLGASIVSGTVTVVILLVWLLVWLLQLLD